MKKIIKYFSIVEYFILTVSFTLIISSYLIYGAEPLTLAASLLGVSALIFCAKGNPIGQFLIIIFALLYGYISYHERYFGEMITYLGMSAPMAVWALISWLKNPYEKGRAEVKTNRIKKSEWIFLASLSLIVTLIFCPVLYLLNTNNLVFSTVSVTTSFLAVYLTARRSPYYALCYALNDIVLIVLWIYASLKNTSNAGVVICFLAFLIHDVYGFINWRRMEKRQNKT